MKTSVIEVEGMLSALSSHGVEKRLGQIRGVHSATVNFAAGSAAVRYDEAQVGITDLQAAVHQCGYGCGSKGHSASVGGRKSSRRDDSTARGMSDAPAATPAVMPVPEPSPPAAAAGAAPPAVPATAPAPAAPHADHAAAAVPVPAAARTLVGTVGARLSTVTVIPLKPMFPAVS